MSAQNPSYNLSKLIAYVGDDHAVIKDMVHIFIQSGTDLLAEINEGVAQKDYQKVSRAAHALKTSLDIFGIDDMYNPIREIELFSKNNTQHDVLIRLSQQLTTRLQHALDQLTIDFKA